MRMPALTAALAVGLTLLGAQFVRGIEPAGHSRQGTLGTGAAYSAALGEDIDYTVYLPAGYDRGKQRYPVLYLLHGRGDTMQAWTQMKATLDTMIAAKRIPPLIAILPDAPWSDRGSWYVDSQYVDGRPVETALTRDLVGYVDATYRTAAIRNARMVGGYSMGGAGALRFALAHQDLFASALVLSPAVYTPLPPSDSSTRDYGAFGQGGTKFVDDVYQKLNYPALLSTVNQDLPVRLFIAVGDDEYANPDPADAHHDLDFESETLYNAARRVPGISAEMRILNGGHDWTVWGPAFEQGMADLGPLLSVVPPTGLPQPLYGDAGTDWAGGAAAHADGSTTLGYAASGRAVLTRLAADGTPQWTRQLSTPGDARLYGVVGLSDGGVLTAGYAKGPGNSVEDAFVARLGADGAVRWLTPFGVAGVADRAYGLTATSDGGGYVVGYTKGALGGANAGDKDSFLARVSPEGHVDWVRQFGGAGEDKAYAVAADASGVYVVGTGWIARFGTDGTPQWTSTVGDRLSAVTVTSTGLAVATGASGSDLLTVAYTSAGVQKWTETFASSAGAAVVPLSGGEVEVVGYTTARVTVPAGGADILTLRLSSTGKQLAAGQYGSARDDGVDPFAEPNLYASPTPAGRVLVTGLTYARGNADVFLG